MSHPDGGSLRARWRSTLRLGAAPAVLALLLSGCGSASDGDTDAAAGAGVDVAASFYPLAFVVARVGGGNINLTDLTKPGVEPHDLELAPRDVARIGESDLVVYLKGFQPAVDDAVASAPGGAALDVTASARLDLQGPPEGGASTPAGDAGTNGQAGDGRGTGAIDPHFWLDPTRLADVADAVAGRLEQVDPPNALDYRANAEQLRSELESLDQEFRSGLATCRNRNLVTSHAAFGYIAARYDFDQVGISGLSPESEPSPQQLKAVTRFVEENNVTTVYYETLVDPAVARTVADETGASTAVLDPLEGLTKASAGSNYVEVMKSNLKTLRAGQGCS